MHLSSIIGLAGGVQTALAASTLLSGGTIIAFDEDAESLKVIRNGALLVTDDKIAKLYETAKPTSLPSDTEIVDCTHKIITPGFIDTHRHGWQTAMRTLASNTTLSDYLFKYGSPGGASTYTAEDVYIGQLTGLLEALNAGVTTTLDHAHHIWSKDTTTAGLDGSIDSGARVFWAASLGTAGDYSIPEQVLDFKELLSAKNKANGLTTITAAFDGWGVEAAEDIQAVVDLIKELQLPVLTTHWLGSVWNFDNSPSRLHSLGILNTSTAVVFSHATGLTPDAYQLLQATDQFISITPESEMHYGHSHFHSHQAQDQAALGVDTHLTFSTDMLTQARLWLQRTRSRLFDEVIARWQVPRNNPMSVNQAFLLATRQGARALRRPDLGVIREGAKADLVVFDGRAPGLLGWADPVAAVLLHANVGDIEHVLVDGQFRKRDRRLTFHGYDGVVDRFLASADRIQRVIRERPAPALPDRWLGFGCEMGVAATAKVLRGAGTGYGSLFVDPGSNSGTGSAEKGHDEL